MLEPHAFISVVLDQLRDFGIRSVDEFSNRSCARDVILRIDHNEGRNPQALGANLFAVDNQLPSAEAIFLEQGMEHVLHEPAR